MFLKRGTVGVILSILVTGCIKSSLGTSRIEFLAGGYSKILVAINPEIGIDRCQKVLQDIRSSLWGTSVKLHAATDELVRLANIRILLPRDWNPTTCGLAGSEVIQATTADSYSTADIKITGSHPIAKYLPWTSQFRGCGQSGDDIFIPPDFLGSPDFTDDQRHQLLLHEWAKFRYGVFEEFGYFGDETYPACYVRGGNLHFTSCSATVPDPLTNYTEADCRAEISGKAADLRSSLESGTSSVMSMPHLTNTGRFCNQANHNRFGTTKQNVQCNRRSIRDVVDSHPDFVSSRHSNKQVENLPPQFEIVRHYFNTYSPGYAFIIEDTEFIRQDSRLRQIKQAIVQMVDTVDTTSGTTAGIFKFSGGTVAEPIMFYTLNNDEEKRKFINLLPDVNTKSFVSKMSNGSLSAKQSQGANNLYMVFDKIIAELGTRSHKWHIFLVTSSPSSNVREARDKLHETPYSLSVLTFDETTNWLPLYTTPNTKNVMVVPNCTTSGIPCSTKPTALAVDEFVEVMRSQGTPRFLEKVSQTEVTNVIGETAYFTVQSAPSVTKFYVHLPVFTNLMTNQIQFVSPSRVTCLSSKVLEYEYLYSIQGCSYEPGRWSVDLAQLAENVNYTIQAFVETEEIQQSRLTVRTSYGTVPTAEILPNFQPTAVYARVTDLSDRPVIGADVEINIHISSSSVDTWQQVLNDDGLDPDITRNDGVYSTYLQNYAPTAAFHIGQLKVTSVSSQTSLIVSLRNEGLDPYSAALLDPLLSSKCCGSSVPLGNTLPVPVSHYSAMLPGFRTGEGFDSTTLPPGKIGNIRVAEDDGEGPILLEFIAPGATVAGGRVHHYASCCSVDDSADSSCHPIPPSSCSPVDPGTIQTCNLDRDGLKATYVNGITPPSAGEEDRTVYLYCGIRGVSSQYVEGPPSNSLLEISITLAAGGNNENSTGGVGVLKCESISDDCLPIWVFWTLIGCVGGLLLVLLAVIICWCCASRGKKSGTGKNKEEVLMKMNREPKMPDKDSPLYNVYVNKAYIQDADGQMKLVAAEGELLPFETNENDVDIARTNNNRPHISAPIPSVRRRSVSAEIDRDRNEHPHQGMDDTRLYKSYVGHKPNPPPKPTKPSTFAEPEENLQFPIARNRNPKLESGYANSNKDHSPNRVPISTISSSRHDDDIVPIYASVNRNGRRVYPERPPIGGMLNLNQNSTFHRPPSKATNERPHSSNFSSGSGDNMPVQNRFSRPVSASSLAHPQSLPPTRPTSARLDAFPSSDSDSYSDMSRGVPMHPAPPPVPPPFPNGALNNGSNLRPSIRNHHNPPQALPNSNRMTARSPPRQSGLSSPLGPPPPPPAPPRQSEHIPTNHPNKLQHSDDEFDDDSDNWSDEDFEFTPAGDSFA